MIRRNIMFTFIKKLLGYPTEAEQAAAKAQAEAPYKVEIKVEEPLVKLGPEPTEAPALVAPAAEVAKPKKKPATKKAPASKKAGAPKKPKAPKSK